MNILKQFQYAVLATALSVCLPVNAENSSGEFNQAELDQMLAPIALYPDVLLSQVLMAATYPLEVVEAARWSRANSELEGDAAVTAVEQMDWDSSVRALVAFPELIQLMDENLSWTRRLGEAFLLQEEQVMQTAQNLRRRSQDEGTLDDMEHVVVEEEEDVIVIEPADVEVVYVPYYQPYYVYGNWWWNDYPPYYWDPPFGYWGGIGFYWGSGLRISTGFYFSSCDWYRHRVVVHKYPRYPKHYHRHPTPDRPGYRYNPPEKWRHNPDHRRGVRYKNPELTDRYAHRRPPSSGRPPGGSSINRVPDRKPGRPDKANVTRPDRIHRPDQATRTTRPDRSRSPNSTNRIIRPDQRTQPGKSNRIARKPSDNNRTKPTARPPRETGSSGNSRGDRPSVAKKSPKPPSTPKPPVTYSSERSNSNSSYSSGSSSRSSRSTSVSRPSRSYSGNHRKVPNTPRKN